MTRHVTVFCNRGTPAEALAWFEERNAATEQEAGGGWAASFRVPEGEIEFRYDPEYSSEPNWSTQINGMLGFVSEFPYPDPAWKRNVAHTIFSFRWAISSTSEPEIAAGDDTRLEILNQLATSLDAVLFLGSEFTDPCFRALASPEGAHPEATFPELPAEGEGDYEEHEPEPPSGERVINRLYALLALAARGLLEQNLAVGNEPAYTVAELAAWAEELNLADELDPQEAARLAAPAGELSERDAIHCVWRFEGIAVLGWALGLLSLPAYDTVVEVDDVLAQLGFLDVPLSQSKQASAELRPPEELVAYQRQALFVNWRMVDFRVNPRALDYVDVITGIFSKYFGDDLDLSWARLAEGDLAVGSDPIASADPSGVGRTSSIAVERHKAANWLQEGGVYSQVDTST